MKRQATAIWKGDLENGGGVVSSQSGVLTNQGYDFNGRFKDEEGRSGTNPEELIAAAHASCFAMQLSAYLAQNGTPGSRVQATATVELKPGEGIKGSHLNLEAEVPGIDQAKFEELANKAKAECHVSRALGAIDITLETKLV